MSQRPRCLESCEREKREKPELCARHETLDRRFKQWGILKQQFQNGKEEHQSAFCATAVMTQMDVNSGNVSFDCQPRMRKQEAFCLSTGSQIQSVDDVDVNAKIMCQKCVLKTEKTTCKEPILLSLNQFCGF